MNRPINIPEIEIGEELGRGANSVVYRARYRGNPCALKIPRTRGRWTRWVYREAVALARVRHPSLPAVLEVGEAEDLPYLVMELVEGETLGERLRRGSFDDAATLDLAMHLADALAAVHDAGLVHRDVKPRNIILERGARVRLVDFGFAAPMDRSPHSADGADGAGTPGYSAPEQFRTPSLVDGRADLYALGRVMQDCLASRTDLTGSRAEPLAAIAAGLVCDDPDARYPDARSLWADLESVRGGVAARGPRAHQAIRYARPLVGRDVELERLASAWAETGPKSGSICVVRGERGSGKTHLLAKTGANARASMGRVVEVRCSMGDAPLATLRRIFEAFRANGSEQADALRAVATDQLASFAKLIAPKLEDVLEEGTVLPAAGPEAFAEGATEMLVRLARRVGRLLLSVDDFQWIDPVSRDVLVRVAHRVQEAPLLLVIGTRAEADVLPRGRSTTLDLHALKEPQIAALIAAHLGQKTLDVALTRRIATLADGTPLGVLEVLGAFLDVGAVRPHARSWLLDPARAKSVVLPNGALALLGHRLAEIPPATRVVLEAAAILGTTFASALLARVVELEIDDLEYALADGRRAGLIEREESKTHRFVHDSLREMLDGALRADDRRTLNQRVAETLDEETVSSLEALCARARHYAAGHIAKTPERAYRAARAAADAALERFDNEMALGFLEDARVAANQGGLALDPSLHRSLGEAQLRLGALDESLRSLEAALESAHVAEERATLLGRIAWVHRTRAEPELAWAALARAFEAVGASMPTSSATSAAKTASQLARSRLRELTGRGPSKAEADFVDVLCELHYQNARLGLEYGKPLPLVQSALEARRLTSLLAPSRARARAGAMYGVVLTALGRHSAGADELSRAREMASALADPVTHAFCLQLQAMSAAFAGSLDQSLALMQECLDEHGHWLELNEYGANAGVGDFTEALRGRPSKAWAWIARAIERLRRGHETSRVIVAYLIHRARATLASMDRTADGDRWLAAQLDAVTTGRLAARGFYELLSWGPRARFFVETGELGPEFEALVHAFEREGYNARSSHFAVSEYYASVAHARIHQCLRAGPADRAPHVRALRRAAKDLRTAAKVPLLEAHRLLADAYLAWFDGSSRRARKLFGEAEVLAAQESCSWVRYGVARGRAHMLREEGRLDAARDQARAAEALACAHGAEPRARFIREELGLPGRVPTGGPSVRSSHSSAPLRARRQLASLLHIVGGPHVGLGPDKQASAILDNVLRDLEADRGLLWFQPDLDGAAGVLIGRDRAGEPWPPEKGWRDTLIRNVRATGEPWAADHSGSDGSVDPACILAFPLFVYEDAVGAVYVERRATKSPFSPEERELLDLVSHQVPIALEMARLLEERAQLQASLQQAQKMEAVGQLAGGVAHDFNNMLTIVRSSLDHLATNNGLGPEVIEELSVISQAADRAAALTRQLLSFSRHQPASRMPVDVNAAIAELVPMLHRVVGDRASVDVRLGSSVDPAMTDRAALEQALVNLVVNARDAMSEGGTVTISTHVAALDEESARRGLPKPGDYVIIDVTDTGSGMTAEVVSRVFDPFFTTKPSGGGTGLGMTMVYAFAKNSGGHVTVESEVGRGTTFRLYLPQSHEAMTSAAVNTAPAKRAVYRDDLAILVVDDDLLLRESVRRVLHRAGYRVLTASGSTEALEIVGRLSRELSLIVLDVMMPGMTGPELARRIAELGVPAKVLFISGFAPGNIPVEAGAVTSETLLQKPFGGTELLLRVGQLVGE